MPRLALGIVAAGLVSILLTVAMVVGAATLPGGVPPIAAAALAAFGGAAIVLGLWMLEPRPSQSLSG